MNHEIQEYLNRVTNVDALATEAESIGHNITENQMDCIDLEEKQRAAFDKADAILAEIESAVATEKDIETGKLAYSNESARKSEVKVRCMKSKEYMAAEKEARSTEKALKKNRAHAMGLERMFNIKMELLRFNSNSGARNWR